MPSNKRRKKGTSRDIPLEACAFCYLTINDDFRFGEFLHEGDMSCHNFCLLFASGLSQSGEDHEGMNGFMLNHIKEELERGSKLYCSYCKKKGATIGCSIRKCKKKYHFNCGYDNQVLYEFVGNYKSYCKEHKPCQKGSAITKNKTLCHICFELISAEDDCFFCTACRGDWFHRSCLQVYAFKAGSYHFKCPLCNNKDKFSQEALANGINIPEKDAAWELEENAYHELYSCQECSAVACICPKGRKFKGDSMPWDLVTCCICGSNSMHVGCAERNVSMTEWMCEDCEEIESRLTPRISLRKKKLIDDSTIGACESSDRPRTRSEVSSSVPISNKYILNNERLNIQPIVVLQRLSIDAYFQSIADRRNSTTSKECLSQGKCLMTYFKGNCDCMHHYTGKLQNITNMTFCPGSNVFPNSVGYKKARPLKKHRNKLSDKSHYSKDLNVVKLDSFFKTMPQNLN